MQQERSAELVVVAAVQAPEPRQEQPPVSLPGLLEPLAGLQRHFSPGRNIADSRHQNRELLIGERDRP